LLSSAAWMRIYFIPSNPHAAQLACMHAEFVMISLCLLVQVLCWLLVDYNPQSKRFRMQRFFLRMQLFFI
jgi:hypothetical protein